MGRRDLPGWVDGQTALASTVVTDPPGTLEGFRAYMLQQHGIQAQDEALEYALRRARSYSGNEAGVYTVASRWVLQAADNQDEP